MIDTSIAAFDKNLSKLTFNAEIRIVNNMRVLEGMTVKSVTLCTSPYQTPATLIIAKENEQHYMVLSLTEIIRDTITEGFIPETSRLEASLYEIITWIHDGYIETDLINKAGFFNEERMKASYMLMRLNREINDIYYDLPKTNENPHLKLILSRMNILTTRIRTLAHVMTENPDMQYQTSIRMLHELSIALQTDIQKEGVILSKPHNL